MLRAAYFAALAAVAIVITHGYVLKLPVLRGNPILGPACLTQPGVERYAFPGGLDALNNLLCKLNTVFWGARDSPTSAPLMQTFGGVFVAVVMISVYESFRPSARRSWPARGAWLFLLVSQVILAAVGMPIYFAFASRTLPRGPGAVTNRSAAKYAWTALLATVLGLGVPTGWLEATHWSYRALSIWQIFPVYIFALNLVLPHVLGWTRSRIPPIILISVVAIAQSVAAQRVTFASGYSFADIYIKPWTAAIAPNATLTDAGQLIFVADYILTTLAAASWAVLALKPRSAGATIAYTLILAALSVVAGPGAGIVILWAYGEIRTEGVPHGKSD